MLASCLSPDCFQKYLKGKFTTVRLEQIDLAEFEKERTTDDQSVND